MKITPILTALVLLAGTTHAQLRWYKGNTHTHTLWSDGDAAPEIAVQWYKDNDFDFLSLSEHNIFAAGHIQRWYPITQDGLLTPERVDQLIEQYGQDHVQTKHEHGRHYMRLKTLPELQEQFQDDTFLLIPGQEITSNYPPIHVNALNIRELAPAVNFVDNQEGFVANIEFIKNQSQKYNIPTFAHFNHPNWRDGYTVEDVLPIDGPLHFEIFNGHPYVWNFGDPQKLKISYDRFWDIQLAIRLKRNPKNILYGIGVSDSHEYFKFGPKEANPGRGFCMVRAEALTQEAILNALIRGDYYASSGVILNDIKHTLASYTIQIQEEPGATYTTQFIGTRKGFDDTATPYLDEDGNPRTDVSQKYSNEIGIILHETTQSPAIYNIQGDEMYIRAKIISTLPLDSPFQEGGIQTAWTQPILISP